MPLAVASLCRAGPRKSADIWILPWPAASATAPAITPAAEQQLARGPCPASGSSHPRVACHSGPARGAACRRARPLRRSRDGSDDLSPPAHPRPGDHVEQAFPYWQAENLNQCPYLHPPCSHRRRAQESCRPEGHTAEHAGDRASGPGHQSAASSTVHPNLHDMRVSGRRDMRILRASVGCTCWAVWDRGEGEVDCTQRPEGP